MPHHTNACDGAYYIGRSKASFKYFPQKMSPFAKQNTYIVVPSLTKEKYIGGGVVSYRNYFRY